MRRGSLDKSIRRDLHRAGVESRHQTILLGRVDRKCADSSDGRNHSRWQISGPRLRAGSFRFRMGILRVLRRHVRAYRYGTGIRSC